MTPADAYLATLAPTTQRVAASDMRQLDRVSPGWRALDVGSAVQLHAALAQRYRPGTGNRLLAVARGVVRSAWRLGQIDTDRRERLLDALPRLRGGRIERGRTLTWGQVQILLSGARSRQERALLALLAGTGVRRSEAATLTWDRVRRLGPGACYITVLGKGNKERVLRLPVWAETALYDWRKVTIARKVFGWSDGDGIHEVVRAAGLRAGLGPLAPHDLRRTFFGLCRESGLDLPTIARSMGHAQIATTFKYDRRTEGEVQAEMAALDRLTTDPTTGNPGGET